MCGSHITVYNTSALLIAEVTVFEIASAVCLCQTCYRSKILLSVFLPVRGDIETALPSNSLRRASGEYVSKPLFNVEGQTSIFSIIYGFYGYGTNGVKLSRGQQDAKIVILVNVQHSGLNLVVFTL